MRWSKSQIASWREHLLNWYQTNARELPWRGETDPYKIMVSEFMLVQTQVAAVIPYYQRFIDQFPTLTALANAPMEETHKAWEGLGYYSRVRNLKAASQAIVQTYGGIFPEEPGELLKLPGIGDYMAGAIASIAFGKMTPAVDGNVIRVISRLAGIKDDVSKAVSKKKIKEYALELIKAGNPGDINQALMDLGSGICKPKNPDCDTCPLSEQCLARKNNIQSELPFNSKQTEIINRNDTAFIIHYQDKIALRQVPAGEIWSGLWTLPWLTVDDNEQVLSQLIRIMPDFQTDAAPLLFTTISHSVTKYKIKLKIYLVHLIELMPLPSGVEWVGGGDVQIRALPAPHKKAIHKYMAETENPSPP